MARSINRMLRATSMAATFLLLAASATAQAPRTISFQGQLNQTGNPSATPSLTFRIYNCATCTTSANLLWNETQTVQLNNWTFNVILGNNSGNPLDIPFNEQYWIGVTVGTGTEMTPRIQLTSSPYALNTDRVAGRDVSTSAPSSGQVLKWNSTSSQWEPSVNSPAGSAGGDLGGSYPNPSVEKLQSREVSPDEPSDGDVLTWNATAEEWEPASAPCDLDCYIHNSTDLQSNANFNISGSGTADEFRLQGTGTGYTALTAGDQGENNIIYTLPTDAPTSDGQVLSSATNGGMSWSSLPSSLPPSGSAGGDLSGTYPNPTIADDAITSGKIADGSIASADLATLAVTDAKVNDVAYSKITGAPTSLPPSGAAGGDLSGNYPNPSVTKLQGTEVSAAVPSNGQVLKFNSGTWGPAIDAIGLVNFTESVNTAAPNATVPVVQLRANNAATNVDVTLTPKGTGALTAHVADNTATGGNKRGTGAVDWQTQRFSATEVASGDYATIVGGDHNTASGTASTAMGYGTHATNYASTAMGYATSSSGLGSTAMGYFTNASGGQSTAMGQQTTASGNKSTAMGYLTTASGLASMAMGQQTTASGDMSTAMGSSTTASGEGSTAMGANTTASGTRSTAMGFRASTNLMNGSFVYGDNSTTTEMNATANNQFSVRATGGYRFFSDPLTTEANALYLSSGLGNVGLGVASPSAKLDVRNGSVILSNTGTPGELRLQGTGTGRTAFKAGAQGATNITYTLPTAAPSANGQVLSSTTGGTMSWSSLPSSLPPSGSAGGDLSGTYPNPSVAKLRGITVSTTAPFHGQVLKYIFPTGWEPSTVLMNFTENVHTSTPNATVPVVQLLATNGATNVDVALTPKGTGALTAQVAGTGFIGGNKRGPNAVDWQMSRGAATQVASGELSAIVGGYGNTASGYGSFAMGTSSTASGDISTALGQGTIASGTGSTAMGTNTTASGDFTTAMGYFASTNGKTGAFVYGDRSTLTTMNATADNQFNVRAAGGYRFFSDAGTTTSAGVFIAPGGNVGLGQSSPSEKLDVNGNVAFSGALMPAGSAGTSGQVLTSAGSGSAPTWESLPSSLPPNGSAGGDLSGTYPNPNVARLQGRGVSTTAPGNGQVLKFNSGTSNWEPATDAGGLTNFTESVNTSAPNATVPVVQLLANNGATNVDVALTPKGTGALTAQIANNAVSGGNKRGGSAVDWQTFRTAATQVASGLLATIVGGGKNTASGAYSTAMGENTTASGDNSTAMGWNSTASNDFSTAIGKGTSASGLGSTAMGYQTTASGEQSIAMGVNTTASGAPSMAMGYATTASGNHSTAMGHTTTASGDFTTAMGVETVASGLASTAMGFRDTASGNYSTAMGYYASTNGATGAFVYGDASITTTVNATANNQFMVRAAGGTIFYSNSGLTAGVSLAAGGGSWASVSDVNKKENFRMEDGEIVLSKLSAIPVTSWNYKSQDASIRHLGPMAQDFHAAFGLGESDTTITTVDIDGVNMLAIQALEKRTTELLLKTTEIETLRTENRELAERLKALEEMVARLAGRKEGEGSLSLNDRAMPR